jgi:2-polyprenyl-3-methyl-5-hydroxy-6-metoxy-1,4-benzoquinol methylase
MPAASIEAAMPSRAPSGRDRRLAAVRSYWDENVSHWPIATAPVGTLPFFEQTEQYRFEKLDYLPRRIDFAGWAGQRVLDLGCGIGNDAARFARGGAEVTGIDLASGAIELARRNFALRGLAGTFRVMDGEALEFQDDAFDLVYCHTVLHFTPEPARMVRQIHRVLKPGGQAILMVVNRRSWLRFMHRVARVEIDHLAAPVFHWFTREEFAALLAPFAEARIVVERFPVRTKVHKGLKARLFNLLFVDSFNALPRAWVESFGHHLLAFARKAESRR